jgi:hypothetical protein
MGKGTFWKNTLNAFATWRIASGCPVSPTKFGPSVVIGHRRTAPDEHCNAATDPEMRLATSRRKIRTGCRGARIRQKAEICKVERISG